jgi:ribonucleoside-diphosphate reductase alpha chain
MFDKESFKEAVRDCVVGLNEVLEEGLPLHPLQIQKENVSKYRQIGLGVMGIADMLIKLNIRYGSDEAVKLCEELSNLMLNEAIKQSSLLAKEHGAFEMYNEEAIFNSKFFINNVNDEVKELVRKYGLRNSQLLTIPPTGTISTMLGISGGIEPIFNISYFRKTESIHNEDKIYKVYTPIVKEYMDINEIDKEEDLSDIFVTAMNLKPQERIKMQQAWQKNIDASISSTINLPYEATVEDVYDIYMSAWKNDLKGITIYRDGCKRSGILTNEDTDKKKDNEVEIEEIAIDMEVEEGMEKFVCPECKNEAIIPTGGCGICLQCGYSKCN